MKNRNYPNLALREAIEIPKAIADGASGMPVSRLTLAELVNRSPAASGFRDLLLASRAYGLTKGGVNADQFELTTLGSEITGADEVQQVSARRKAVLNVVPFRLFLNAYNGKKVPSPGPFREFLTQAAEVPPEWADDCMAHVLADAEYAAVIRNLKGSKYIELGASVTPEAGAAQEPEAEEDGSDVPEIEQVTPIEQEHPPLPPRKVFIAHGKNRAPLEELKKMLDQFRVRYAVAVDEPHKGRPISAKVATLMKEECSSAIFIFTADERFETTDKDGGATEVWRPSENLVYELGAASVLYDRRIVIFKDSRVSFPSDFSDLGYIEFEEGQLAEKMGSLFAELVSLDILEVRAKS